jgi:alkylated DNA repair dioxygenase AlkB
MDLPGAQLLFSCPEGSARVTYHAGYLLRDTADALLAWLCAHTPWQVEAPVMFGVARPVRRRSFAYGEPGARYRYSGLDRDAAPWPAPLVPVVERLRAELAVRFDFGLCNLYPDGEAQLGRHADDERDIAPGSPIAGLSLGATRDFVLYARRGPRVAARALEHGSLLVMWGSTQRHFEHAVPRRLRVTEPRVSITFRVLADRARSGAGAGVLLGSGLDEPPPARGLQPGAVSVPWRRTTSSRPAPYLWTLAGPMPWACSSSAAVHGRSAAISRSARSLATM